MQRVLNLVEGQTEEGVVGRVLKPHLAPLGVYLIPVVLKTKRVPAGPDHKGGASSWAQILGDIKGLLHDTAAVAVTTMLDYYGLPLDVPGMDDRPSATALDRARHVEAAMNAEVGHGRFRAHLMLHETEALLYADPDACGQYLDSPAVAAAMRSAVDACGSPEEVNDSATTAPSKRILAACPAYRKTLDGPVLAERIGLHTIRRECPHFDGWVAWLESLGSAR